MKVGIVWENGVSKWMSQMFEPLAGFPGVDIDLFVGDRNKFDTSEITLRKRFLTHREEVMLGARSFLSSFGRLERGPYRRMDFYFHSLEKYMNGYDIIECYDSSRSLYTVARLKKKKGYKLVVSYLENIPYRQVFDPKTNYIKHYAKEHIDHYIPWCDTIKNVLLLEGIPEEKVTTVYTGIDMKLFRPEPKDETLLKEYDIPDASFTVLYIGKLVSWKGVHSIVYAAADLRRKGYKDFTVLITGRGAQFENLKKIISEAGLEDHFRFTGFLPYSSIKRLHNLADVFVLPSLPTMTWQEQLGMVLVEAMACAKPVVAAASGSIPEVVADTGLLFTPGNFFELSERISRLMDDRPLLKALGTKARERALTHFDAGKNAEQIYQIYRRVLGHK